MSRRSVLVLDSSAAAELIFHDPAAEPVATELKQALLAGMRVIGPTALLSEVQAVISTRFRRKAIDADAARECSDMWQMMIDKVPIDVGTHHDCHVDALAMSLALGHSYYDCLYLSLARLREGELLTCDVSLAHKAMAGGIAYRLPILSPV